MTYQIKCDEYVLYDHRDEELMVLEPTVKLGINTIGEASFNILKTHKFYGKLHNLKSVIEVKKDNFVLFRGRITNHSRDFNNMKRVDIEGALGYANDTLIPPFTFPDDFTLSEGDNPVEVLLNWVIDQHNAQVENFQKFKLGTVTVTDPNDVIVRSAEHYESTWEILRTRFFESSLGGYLCARYESDGTYIDYLSEFTLTNVQKIELTQNLLDLQNDTSTEETYTACLPVGAEIEVPEVVDDDGNVITEAYKYRLTLESLPDGDLTDDVVKRGNFIYSKSGVEQYGYICSPVDVTTWEDVTEVNNLKSKAVDWLTHEGIMLTNTITLTALDLNLTDEQIQTFRIYRNIIVNSKPHGLENAVYQLTELDIDILNPQNTTITIGDVQKSFTGESNRTNYENAQKIEQVAELTDEMNTDITEVQNQIVRTETSAVATATEIIFDALKEYVEVSNYTEFRETVEASLQILADQIDLNFTTTTTDISNVDGDLQQKFNLISKYMTFDINGITIGSNESPLKLSVDNDEIKFMKDGEIIGRWTGSDFYTGNIVVEVNERAQFGNFAFIPRSDGSLMFLKVG